MIKKIIYIFFFTFLFSSAKSETIKEIVIEGNKRVSDETVKIYGEVKSRCISSCLDCFS